MGPWEQGGGAHKKGRAARQRGGAPTLPLISPPRAPRPPPRSPPRAPRRAAAGPVALRTLAAVAGHDKDINAAAVAPNDALCATASQDRTVRLWALPGLAAGATLRGHKRGVWAVEFSPVDQVRSSGGEGKEGGSWQAPRRASHTQRHRHAPSQTSHTSTPVSLNPIYLNPLISRPPHSLSTPLRQVVISASGDKTLKLWSLKDGACLRTFEGHGAGVLRCRFATAGQQALSTGAWAGGRAGARVASLGQRRCARRRRPSHPVVPPPAVAASPPTLRATIMRLQPAQLRAASCPHAPHFLPAPFLPSHAALPPRPPPPGADGLLRL